MLLRTGLILLLCLSAGAAVPDATQILSRDYSSWTLAEATRILNRSPWARKQTYTRVVGGVGSGIHGEKEIFNTFFVRLLSAPPIRRAYARVQQLQNGYDEMTQAEKRRLDAGIAPGLNMDVSRWIVVTISFRSNNPNMELSVKRFFDSQTLETMRDRAYLATEGFPRIELAAYFPPREEAVGAKFVFPRRIDGVAVVSPDQKEVNFEVNIPSVYRRLRVNFPVSDMLVEGALVL